MASGKFRSRNKQVNFKNPGDHDPALCNHRLNGKLIHYKPSSVLEGRELIRVDDIAGQRNLLIPSRKPNDLPGIFPKSEFDRLKQQAHVVTMQDKIKAVEEEDRKKINLQNESEARKAALKKAQVIQKNIQGSKLSEVEEEAARKSQYLLERAKQLRQEQEDPVKQLNSLILATKCMAIRDAQIAEKELIKKQMEEEERRLDMMMEQNRQKSLQAVEKKKQEEEEKNQRYVMEVTHQIKENDLQRLLEAERKEEEARVLNKTMIALQKEELEKQEKRKDDQRKLRESLLKANDELERYRKTQEEEERISDLRIKEFMRKKLEREEAREAEIVAQNAAKEREINRLRAIQQKAQDSTAIMNEMSAARIQEEVERKWRQAQLVEAQKRKEAAEEMKVGRLKQIDDLRREQALEIARDEQEFHEVNKVQKELHEKELAAIAKKREDAARHRKELLKQIEEKEKERIEMQKEKFEEGNTMRIEHELHSITMKNLLEEKVSKLRQTSLPEKYISDILRHTEALKKNF